MANNAQTSPPSVPTFGNTIRAARLGYHWSSKHGAMIRMSDEGPYFRVDMCPADSLLNSPKGSFRVWWDTPQILEMIPAIARVRKVRKPLSFLVNEAGDLVQEVPRGQ